jgi:2-deoxy-D-gluconate 3-dehydrogenase
VAEPDLFDLSGRHALVTGAAGLLGREFAAALASRGAVVHLIDLHVERVHQLAEQLAPGAAEPPIAVPLDITDEDAVERAVAAAPSVDILVNSAALDPKFEPGLPAPGHFSTYPLELWEASLKVNLTGSFLMARAACRRMQDQGDRGRGAVVNVSSMYGLVGPDQRLYERADGAEFFKPVDYAVTKAGILGLTRAMATMYRDTEIRVNALTPGGTFNGQDDEFLEKYSARTVLGRMAAPQDYRGAVLFLCSDASRYMTGANLVVDGGWTAW